MNLEAFERRPHRAKEILNEHKILVSTVANYLDISYNFTCMILRGDVKPTPQLDLKLEALLAYLTRRPRLKRRNGGNGQGNI